MRIRRSCSSKSDRPALHGGLPAASRPRTPPPLSCWLRLPRTLWRVSCFSTSPSFCALTVPILILYSLLVKASLKVKLSLSSTSLLMGSLRSTFLPAGKRTIGKKRQAAASDTGRVQRKNHT
eukprot:GHRQ01030623.1.p1 GENE.GHRQ01030623.1~~GHRQ01030623.1.p1  ORF type:complete len:122 (+),score=7.62 GHRQ01030623.1:186-551(+)